MSFVKGLKLDFWLLLANTLSENSVTSVEQGHRSRTTSKGISQSQREYNVCRINNFYFLVWFNWSLVIFYLICLLSYSVVLTSFSCGCSKSFASALCFVSILFWFLQLAVALVLRLQDWFTWVTSSRMLHPLQWRLRQRFLGYGRDERRPTVRAQVEKEVRTGNWVGIQTYRFLRIHQKVCHDLKFKFCCSVKIVF